MNKTKKIDIISLIVIALLLLALIFFIAKNEDNNQSINTSSLTHKVMTADDYNGKKLGILTGSSFEDSTLELFPDSEYFYYSNQNDLCLALANGNIDAFIGDEPVLRMVVKENSAISYLPDMLTNLDISFGLTKDNPQTDIYRYQFDEMINDYSENGILVELERKWFGDNDNIKELSQYDFKGKKIHFVTNSSNQPFSYIKNGKLVGFSIEIVYRFCDRYGYTPVFEDTDVSSALAGLTSGKYDIFASALSVTEERKESIDFTSPIYNGGLVLAVRSEDYLNNKELEDDIRNRSISYYAENGKIGTLTGGLYEIEILRRYPNADILQFNSQPDLAVALSKRKIDAFTCSVSTAEDFIKEDNSLTYLNEVFMEIPYGFAFKKSDGKNELRDQLNEYLTKIHSDGTYDEIVNVWFGNDNSKKKVDIPKKGSKVLRYLTASTMQPYSYILNGENAGLEIDIIARFCKEYGYSLAIDNTEFSSLIAGVSSGSYDIASGTIMITEERAQSVDFSDVYYTTNGVTVVRKENTENSENNKSFISKIKISFEKNFIREDRYKLILRGIGTTCLITILSTIFGTILAFLICMYRRTGSKVANFVTKIYIKILQGTPLVVLLMILYYIIFGNTSISAIWVAIIGFSLNFGAYTSEVMRSGIDSVDKGQREAGLALGFNENQSFFRFIFPQAAIRILPVYRGEIISLLKSTSIVGYIAIQDITKMSDIIRSRTYEAFFPLIITAIIYFLLAGIISQILKIVLHLLSHKSK